ncbi:MAG: Holliday junction resolvase RuvX [Oscillospiraceae bacterium]|nr:Holliday junction resolvase RuvX [Oscillospiraceae bacterium]
MKKYLGVDFGEARTGLAVSDSLGLMAHGIGTVKTGGFANLIQVIKEKLAEYSINSIVVGNPVNMNGSVGEKSGVIQMLAERIKMELGVEVILFDERCTTMTAHKILNETDTRGKKRKAVIDTLAAEIILQNYLDSISKL